MTLKLNSIVALLLVSASLLLNGCVSVNLGPRKAGRASNIRYQAPGVDFQDADNSSADKAWQSRKTGSTISFLSECPEPSLPLEAMTREFVGVLKDSRFLEQNEKFFNGREALQSVAVGSLDGIPMKIESLVFKRNSCSYLLTFVARQDRFNEEVQQFLSFLDGFQAP